VAKITQAAKADMILDEWDEKLAKLRTQYSQDLTNKMKVALMYSMLPKDLQEKVFDACSVAWDGTSEGDARELYLKVKSQVKNLAKARREMQGPKPMEVDRVWPDQWGEQEAKNEENNEHQQEDAYVQFIGSGGGKSKGKGGFQGKCFTCGGFGHTQWECGKAKGKGKGYGKDGFKGGYCKGGFKGGYWNKGYGKDGFKGYGKDG
jgi:hypothetical protein